nr:hypothetical protein [uncultured Roseateles sp.]
MSAAHRHAPPLRVDILPQPRLQALIAAMACLAAFCFVLALMQHLPQAWPLMALLPIVAVLAWRMARVSGRRLQWDGQCWRLSQSLDEEAQQEVLVAVAIDFDRWLLLRLREPTAPWFSPVEYLPLSAAQQGAMWGQLRATLFAARLRQ